MPTPTMMNATAIAPRPVPTVQTQGQIGSGVAQSQACVLLVEDHEDFHQALSLRLKSAGLKVLSAFSGFGALCSMVEKKPDLVVLDLGLPDLHGLDLMHFVKTTPGIQKIPVIVLTGDTDPALEERALGLGVRRILHKPVCQRTILNTIREILKQ